MGLSKVTSWVAARHAHALVVEIPGWGRTRMLVERAVLARGWQLARSPADADVLVVCGVPGSQFTEAVDLVWHQMPGPRVRVEVLKHNDTADVLDDAHARLLEHAHHQRDAIHRPGADDLLAHQSHDAEAGHGGHEGNGDMDMSPGGIPLAEGGSDRDGLEMDALNFRLGPVLPYWPAGLVLDCSLQGDVVTKARAEVLGAGDEAGDEVDARTRGLDNLVSVLALAGWDDAAVRARRLRDATLGTGDGPAELGGLERLRRRVHRSWALRWSLQGLRPLTEEEARHCGLPVDAVGDTYDRLIAMVDRAAAAPRHADHPAVGVDRLGDLVVGLDLAAVRLVLASVDIHELRPDHAAHEVTHG